MKGIVVPLGASPVAESVLTVVACHSLLRLGRINRAAVSALGRRWDA